MTGLRLVFVQVTPPTTPSSAHDDLLSIAGHRIGPGEIEECLTAIPRLHGGSDRNPG